MTGGLTEIDILKLDIEGAEYEVFSRNYESWIHRVEVIIVECADKDRPGTTQAMFRALSAWTSTRMSPAKTSY